MDTSALLDTGAAICCVQENFFNMITKVRKVQTYPCNTTVVVGNSNTISVTEFAVLKVKIGKFTWRHKFLIVPKLTCPVILGLDFIGRANIAINPANNHIIFSFDKKNKIHLVHNINKINTSPITPLEITKKLQSLYPDVLTNRLGHTDVIKYDISLKEGAVLDSRRFRSWYRSGPEKYQALKTKIDSLLREGIIEPIRTSFASPCFLVPKKTGDSVTKDYRLVVDYRHLNSKINYITQQTPTLEEALIHLRDGIIFSVFDLNKAYHQIGLTENSKKLTSFQVPWGTYAYNRIPFGLATGGQILTILMETIFGDLLFKNVFYYFDDLVVYSADYETHFSHLQTVFNRLRAAKLTVNINKMQIAQKKINFLGHVIQHRQVSIGQERIRAIVDLPKPRTPKQIAQFLGAMNFFSRFIPDLAKIANPLNQLRKKNSPMVWTKECDESWQTLKDKITSPPVLTTPDFSKRFAMFTDGSALGISACLAQEMDGAYKPIAFSSRKLKGFEANYSAYDIEALAISYGLEKYRIYLENSEFDLFTDHKALTSVINMQSQGGRYARFATRLMGFRYKIKHIKGKLNNIADYLSRNPVDHASNGSDLNILKFIPGAFKNIRLEQANDQEITEIIDRLKKGNKVENYLVQNNTLYYKLGKNKLRVVAPKTLWDTIFKYFHSSLIGGHLGITRTLNKIRDLFYFKGMATFITNNVKNCLTCAKAKVEQRLPAGNMSSFESERPGDRLFIDLAGPLPNSGGYRHIFVAIDDFSRFILLYPLRSATASSVLGILKEIFKNFGYWGQIVSDNASIFRSKLYKEFLFEHGVTPRFLIRHYPNPSKAERCLRDLKTALVAFYADNQSKWAESLQYLQVALNSATNSSTQYTPSQIFLGRHMNTPLNIEWDIQYDQLNNNCRKLWKNALSNVMKAKIKSKKFYDMKHRKVELDIGEHVLLKTYNISDSSKNFAAKLAFKFNGPYVVIKKLSDVSYLLQNVNDPNEEKRAHISQCKPLNKKKNKIKK